MKARKLQLGIVLVVALSVSLWLVGCGSSGSASTTGTGGSSDSERTTASTSRPSPAPTAGGASPSTSAASAEEIKVTLKNNTFPKEIRVKAGTKVVFLITNQSTVKHTFEFPDFHINNEIQPEQTLRFEWVVPNRKGSWDMGCFLTEEGFHERMEGTLIIE